MHHLAAQHLPRRGNMGHHQTHEDAMSFHSNILEFPARPVSVVGAEVCTMGADVRALSAPTPIRRPAALIRAARAGIAGWDRDRDLARLWGAGALPEPGRALGRLLEEEAALDTARRAGAADYDPRRHVLLAIAILAERRAAILAPLSPAAGRAR